MNVIQFVKVSPSDSLTFFALRRAAILIGCARDYAMSELERWTDPHTDALPEPLPDHFYFAKIKEAIVGSGLVEVSTGQIDAVFVSPAYFGRGIGRAVMQHLEAVAKDNGVATLRLDATLNAANFYRSFGFCGFAKSTYRSPRGILLECVPMTKSLTLKGLSHK